jgi:hypothetical protein
VPWIGFAAGLLLVIVTGSSVINTLLVPRAAAPVLTNVVARVTRDAYRLATDGINDLTRREHVLAKGGPTFLFGLLVSWLGLLYLGFTLIMWPFDSGTGFAGALRLSGSSLFTLGFDAPSGAVPAALVFAEAASGLVVTALLIAYLPVLYAAFNRRETLVNVLEALAGSPPWGPELLARQVLINDLSYLSTVYERWTEWAGDISESHANYRTLIFFRSPDPTGSWLLSLLAVLDGAAMHMALWPSTAPSDARPLLRVGYVTLRQLAKSLRLPVPTDPLPDGPLQLTKAEFAEGVAWITQAGLTPERDTDEAWKHFHGWRVNYEQAAYAIAAMLNLPPALWSGPRRSAFPVPHPPPRPPHREPTQDDTPQGAS